MEFKLEIYAPDTEVVAIRDALNALLRCEQRNTDAAAYHLKH